MKDWPEKTEFWRIMLYGELTADGVNWLYITYNLNGGSGDSGFNFVDWSGNDGSVDYSLEVTSFSYADQFYNANGQLLPEPSTWAMMLLGFAGLGFAGYRRARAGHAALAA